MEKKPIEMLKAYINFRKKIKNLKASNESSIEQCIIITKEDIANWKKLYEYSKLLINNNALLKNWESKINSKYSIKPTLTFHFLKDYNEIKNHLSKGKGISFVNQEFINCFFQANKIFKVNCHFGRKRMVLELNDGIKFSNSLICKVGSKSTSRYIIYETIDNYKSSLIDDLLKKKISSLTKKTIFPSNPINKILTYNCNKIRHANIEIKLDSFGHNFSDSNLNNNGNNSILDNKRIISRSVVNSYSPNINVDYECNIPDCIFEFLILTYKFNKDLRQKIKNKDKSTKDYYILNADFLNHIKMIYNYKGICDELIKFKYKTDKEFESKIPYLINLIKQKDIINEVVPLDDMKIIPNVKSLYSKLLYFNFGIINEKIYHVIEKIIQYFELNEQLKKLENPFYFNPQFFYKGRDVIRIGTLNAEDAFEEHYLISLDLYKTTNLSNLLFQLKDSKTTKDFFLKKNIEIDSKKIHELNNYCYTKVGIIINFKYKNKNDSDNLKCNNNMIKIKDTKSESQKNEDINSINMYNNSYLSEQSTEIQSVISLNYLDNFKIKGIEEIPFTPMIGLQNIGQTCYMNAALQCFSNTRALTKYFLNYNKLNVIKGNKIIIEEINEPSLVVEYLKLIRHLWCDNPKSYYAPKEFKEKIGKIDPLFKNFEANDAKDFVNFMVMRMHEELNCIDNDLVTKNNLNEPPMPLNPYNQGQVLSILKIKI